VRAVAAIPAAGLLAGSVLGLLVPDFHVAAGLTAIALSAAGAVRAWQLARPFALAAAVGAAFFWGGALLAADAWREAWRPTLRSAFEVLARAERADAERSGRRLPDDDGAFAVVTGTLRADASLRANGVSLSLDVRSIGVPTPGGPLEEAGRLNPSAAGAEIAVNGGVALTVVGTLAAQRIDLWRGGRVVRVPARLRRPSRYLNPGVRDEERASARRGTTLVGTVKSGALVEIVERGDRVSESAADLRAHIRGAIASSVGRWSARSAGIVTAIVIGDRAGLDEQVERRLQEAGTYHVIAISGGNIAILTGLVLAIFRLAGRLGRAAMVSAIAGLVSYGYLVGGGASVERATLMAVVYLAGRAVDLRGAPANALALVAAVLVAAQPLAVADPSFLLTFGATAGILCVTPVARSWQVPRPIAPAVMLLAASAAAEAALLPVGAFLFSRVTFAGLLLNFIAIPVMAVAQIAGLAVLPAALASSTLAGAVGWFGHAAAEGLVRSADVVQLAPALTWRVAPPHWLAMAAYYIGLIAAWALWRGRTVFGEGSGWRRWLRLIPVATASAAAIWILAQPWALPGGDDRLHVTFIDVGQGDAALVRFPRGASLLVDAGGLSGAPSFDVGERVVAPVLRAAGVRRLASVALTHGDADHIGGAAAVLREFKPHDVWEGIPVPRLEAFRLLRVAAEELGARWANVQADDLVTIDGVQVLVRHPAIADWERQDVRNDDSIVLELRWRDVSIVLTGDIGRDVERLIAPRFPPARIRIVKVPHHGSLTSSSWEFVRALAPSAAVVSAGRGNVFGHPAPEVLDRYRRAGAEIFRTDRDGAVEVETDGHSVAIRGFTGRQASLP